MFDRHAFSGINEDLDTDKQPEEEDNLDASITIEELVAPDSPVPSDYVIDLIFETATLVTDMKLLLRASNLKAMTTKFNKSKLETEAAMAQIAYQAAQMPHKQSNSTKEVQLPNIDTASVHQPVSPLPPSTPTVQSPKGTITKAMAASPVSKQSTEPVQQPGLSRSSSITNRSTPTRPPLSSQNSSIKEDSPVPPSSSTISLNTTKSASSLSKLRHILV